MDALEGITPEDKLLIRRSWSILKKNINTTALSIFEMIFSQSPDAKQLFPFMRLYQNGSAITHSKEMEFHGLRFMQVIESVIDALDKPSSIDSLCDNLGRVHGRLAEQRGFKPYYWAVFIECTLYHFRKVLENDNYFHNILYLDRTILCWRNVLRVLIKRMKIGFNTDIRNRKANKDGVPVSTLISESSSSTTLNDFSSIQITHSQTLPRISHLANRKCPEKKSESSGFLRPLRQFARRTFHPNRSTSVEKFE
ncbi:unnamed protein product [Auanema sp. JU1783]|nr:unnamed protein product [Auanema sp. JU1783]